MNLLDIDTAVTERFPEAEPNTICQLVNDLEHRINCEIFSPCGIEARNEPLDFRTDTHMPLLLDDGYLLLYVYYVFWGLSINEMNLESANSYSALFNEKYNKLAIFYRRNYMPIKNTPITGRF